jgi:transposase
MHVEPHHSQDQLRSLAKKQKQAKLRIRWQAIVLAREGKTAPQIARSLGIARRTVQQCVQNYNRRGADGLSDLPRSGRPSRLTPDQQQRLRERLDAGPQPEDHVCSLRAADVKRILEREFGVLYALKGVYKLLHRLGYSYLCPRPRHQLADASAQEAFKKTLWLSSKRSEPIILTNA